MKNIGVKVGGVRSGEGVVQIYTCSTIQKTNKLNL